MRLHCAQTKSNSASVLGGCSLLRHFALSRSKEHVLFNSKTVTDYIFFRFRVIKSCERVHKCHFAIALAVRLWRNMFFPIRVCTFIRKPPNSFTLRDPPAYVKFLLKRVVLLALIKVFSC